MNYELAKILWCLFETPTKRYERIASRKVMYSLSFSSTWIGGWLRCLTWCLRLFQFLIASLSVCDCHRCDIIRWGFRLWVALGASWVGLFEMSRIRGIVLGSWAVLVTLVVCLLRDLQFSLCVCGLFLFPFFCLGLSYQAASLVSNLGCWMKAVLSFRFWFRWLFSWASGRFSLGMYFSNHFMSGFPRWSSPRRRYPS